MPDYSQSYAKGDTLELVWKDTIRYIPNLYADGYSGCQHIIDGENVLFIYHQRVLCYNKRSGKQLWTYFDPSVTHDRTKSSQAILEGNRLYVVSNMQTKCLDTKTGTLIWKYSLQVDNSAWLYFNKNSHNGTTLFVNTLLGHIIAIRKSDGSVAWHNTNAIQRKIGYHDPSGACYMSPATYYRGVVYTVSDLYPAPAPTFRSGKVNAFSAETGELLWSVNTPIAPRSTPGTEKFDDKTFQETFSRYTVLATPDGLVCSSGFTLIGLDFDGKVKWQRAIVRGNNISWWFGTGYIMGNNCFVINNGRTMDSFMSSIDANSGVPNWVSDVKSSGGFGSNLESAVIEYDRARNMLWFNSSQMWLFGVDATTGEVKVVSSEQHITKNDFGVTPMLVEYPYVYFITQSNEEQGGNIIYCAKLKKQL